MSNMNPPASYQSLAGENASASKPRQQSLDTLPASSNVGPAFLEWAKQKEMVRPGEDGSLPAMDRGGFGIQSMVWRGPMQTGEASVQEKQDQRERRHLSNAINTIGHGEARVVGGNEDDGPEIKQESARERKRDVFKRLFNNDAQKRRLSRTMGN